MNLLLDTHALLWWLAGDSLEADAAEQIADPDTLVAVSAATVWEIAIKRRLGKLRVKGEMAQHVLAAGFEPMAITLEHAERSGDLPMHHRDPFDRMLVAQCQAESLALVTRDPIFEQYDVTVVRC